MIEVVEESWGYVVRTGTFQDTFENRANAYLAARILATAEAVMRQSNVGIVLPMGNGESVCLGIAAGG